MTSNNISNNFSQRIPIVDFLYNNRIKHESSLIVIEWTTPNDIDVWSDNMSNAVFDDLVINVVILLDTDQVLQSFKTIFFI